MYVTGKTLGESGMETGAAIINSSADTGPDGSPHRAGDYSGTVVDISSAGARMNSFWSGNEYASGGNWATVLENYSISNPVPPPVISSVTADGQNPDTVTGTTSQLAVTASDPSGFSLSYSWSVRSGPSGVTFSNNTVTSTGDTVTANFTQAGNYIFQVTVTDSQGASSTATVNVTVNQTLTSITVSPGSATVADGTTKQFTATAYDQFGHALTTQPAFVTASDPNPGGTITGYTWSLLSGPAAVTFGNSAASSTSVNFARAGTYQFQVVVTDSFGISSTSTVTVTVQQTLSSISLSPSSVTLRNGQSQTFTATGFDQFGNVMTTQPTFNWTWSGIGTFHQTSNTTLQYTAPSTAIGTATLTVSVSGTPFTSTAAITVTRKHH
jgi:hypothetical protein